MSPVDPSQAELNSILLRMGALLVSEESVQSALDLICRLAHATLPSTTGAGVTLIRGGKRWTAAHSDEVVRKADDLQYDLEEGPCLSAWKDRTVYIIESMETEKRWPKWCPAAAGMGMASSLSVPLIARDQVFGATKVYSDQPSSYGEEEARILAMFAEQAAFLLANVQAYNEARDLNEQLKEALKNRDIIAQAKGILMQRENIDDERAFGVLREISQRRNEKVRDVALKLVEDTLGRSNRLKS